MTTTNSNKPVAKKPVVKPATKKPVAKPAVSLAAQAVDMMEASKQAQSKVDKPKGKTITKKTGKALPKVAIKKVFKPLVTLKAGSMTATLNEAIMLVLGMNSIKRKPVPKRDYLGFYSSNTAVSYHTKQGNMEDAGNGLIRLTTQGLSFFAKRLAEGKVIKADAGKVATMLRQGKVKEDFLGFTKAIKFAPFEVAK